MPRRRSRHCSKLYASLPSTRHHRSNGDCLEGKRENYQVCSVQYCVQQLCTHTYMNRPKSPNSCYRTPRRELREVLFFGAVCYRFWLVNQISREPLNGFAPNSPARRLWSLARTTLKVKVKGQGHHGQKKHFSVLSTACMRFIW